MSVVRRVEIPDLKGIEGLSALVMVGKRLQVPTSTPGFPDLDVRNKAQQCRGCSRTQLWRKQCLTFFSCLLFLPLLPLRPALLVARMYMCRRAPGIQPAQQTGSQMWSTLDGARWWEAGIRHTMVLLHTAPAKP